jgi:RNA polymerase sigma-70 factor (ECF subfamily)
MRFGGALRDGTDDLEQQAAMELLESLPRLQWRGKTAFAAWIRRIAEYEVIDARRRQQCRKRDWRVETDLDHADVAPIVGKPRSAESQLDAQRRAEELMRAIGELKEEYATALILHYKGYTHEEIGELLDRGPEAARKLVARARAKLTARGVLSDHGGP